MLRLVANYGSTEAIAKGLNIGLVLLLSTLVDLQTYGLISIIIAIELFLTECVTLGQTTTYLRFRSSYLSSSRSFYQSSLLVITSSTLCVGVIAISLPQQVWQALGAPLAKPDIALLALGIGPYCHGLIYFTHLRSCNKPKDYGLLRIAYQSIKFLSVLGTVFITKNATGYIWGALIANLIILTIIIPRVNHENQAYKVPTSLPTTIIKTNIRTGIPLAIHAIAGILFSVIDRLLIARLLDPQSVAIYHFAFIQGTATIFIVNVLSLAYVPRIYESTKFDAPARIALNQFLATAVISTAVTSIVVYFVAFPLSLQFTADAYASGKYVLAIVLFMVVIHPFRLYGIYKLTALKNITAIPILTVVSLIANVVLNFLLIPPFGIAGAAFAALITETLYAATLTGTAALLNRR